MDLSTSVFITLVGLSVLLVAAALYLRSRWLDQRLQRELDDIGRRLEVGEGDLTVDPDETDPGRSAQLYHLVARAELKVSALEARRRHGEVDLERRRTSAVRALQRVAEFVEEQPRSSSYSGVSKDELDRLAREIESVLPAAIGGEVGFDSDVPIDEADTEEGWARMAATLRSLRDRLRLEYRGAGSDASAEEVDRPVSMRSGPGEPGTDGGPGGR